MILEDVAGWQYPALGDICDVRDGTHDSPKYVEDGFPLITSKNLTEDGLCFEKVSYISQEDHDAIEKRSAVSDGDILYGMIGTVGNPVIVKKDRDFSVKNVAIFKFLEESLIFNKYLFYVLSSDFVGRQISKESKGGTQKFVSLKVLRGLKIPLPPLETQKQIAAVLEQADQLRKDCQQMEQELNNLAQSVFIDMFGDPVTNPKGWEVKSLIDLLISKPQIGTTTPSHNGGNQNVVRVGELGKHEVNYKKCGPITLEGTALEKYKLFEGDYLLARAIGSRDHLGKASLFVEQKGIYVYDSHVMRLRFNDDLMSSQFFYELMKTHGGRSLFLNSSAQTAVQFNINAKQISQIELPVPPVELQNEFFGKLNEIRNLLRLNGVNLVELNTNFDSLIQKAFKGELNL